MGRGRKARGSPGGRGRHSSVPSVGDLIKRGDLERIVPDQEGAKLELEAAETHLQSAEALKRGDPVMAYTALYDAVRKSISAHMLANGIRVKGLVGYHAKTFDHARAALAGLGIDEHLARLEQMRRTRHGGEYRRVMIGTPQVEGDLLHAQAIVAAVRQQLMSQT
jgi:hypothetical protein